MLVCSKYLSDFDRYMLELESQAKQIKAGDAGKDE